MDRYIEMGFSEQAAEAAVERYSDDLHAGCHWLMTRESMGSVPKRLKTSHRTSRTYLGSSIRFEGQRFSVDEFDDMHALIRIRSETSNKARWEHIDDGRMEWIQVQHNQNRISIPRYAWKRKVGTIYFPLEFISGLLFSRNTFNVWCSFYYVICFVSIYIFYNKSSISYYIQKLV